MGYVAKEETVAVTVPVKAVDHEERYKQLLKRAVELLNKNNPELGTLLPLYSLKVQNRLETATVHQGWLQKNRNFELRRALQTAGPPSRARHELLHQRAGPGGLNGKPRLQYISSNPAIKIVVQPKQI